MPAARDHATYLSESHRLELLVASITDYAIFMLDPEGFVVSWNKGAERIKGYSAAEIIGQHYSRFFTEDDRRQKIPETNLQRALRFGRHEAEGWRVRKDGSRFRANALLQALRDDDGALIGFAKITHDVTERVAAEDALRESERRFRLLVEGVTDYAIYMLDPSGVIVNWNAGGERLKGYKADEIVGQHFSKFYTKEDRAAGRPGRVLETAAREGRFEAEGWRVRKDGSRFWASVVVDAIRNPENGRLEGFAKITRDITERRAAQETLRESERQFRLLVAGVTDYALYMLDPNGVITSWNPGAERIKGYRADEIVGQHFSRFYTESDRAAGGPARTLFTALKEGRFEAEGWRVRKDGSLFWANVVVDSIRDERGQLIGFAKITRDITERREAQVALQQAEAQRAHAQKMEALGHLTGGVAHDFNNLLMVVSGHIEGIRRIAGSDPKVARAADAIEQATRRGASLTRQLLSFARRQQFRPKVVALDGRIEALRTMLTTVMGQTVQLVTTVDPALWPVKVDESELELALVNVALNARDAMPKGGLISLSAENVTLATRDPKADIVGDFVALKVVDTGSGIAPDILPRIFDPFFTTKQVGHGSGLGLSQVYGFAHQAGGSVTIDSELGRGTTVTIYLPRTTDAAEGGSPVESAVSSAGGTILVVEDNPEVAVVSVSMLEQLGYRVQPVGSADAALAAIEQQEFDLVLSDIVMAGSMDGLQLARALREKRPNLPIVLVTGYSLALEHADNEFPVLRKPFQLAELARVVAGQMAAARQTVASNVIRLRNS